MRPFKEIRDDPHAPRLLEPADYVLVGDLDTGAGYTFVRHTTLAHHGVETGNSDVRSTLGVPFYDPGEQGRPTYRCHHCGKHGSNIRYFVMFLHEPSKQVVIVGQICAKKLNLASKADLDLQRRRDEFQRREAEESWVVEHPAEYTFLKDHHEAQPFFSEFLNSLWESVNKYGRLTDRQLAALRSNMERVAERKAREADRKQGMVTHTEEPPTDAQLAFIRKLAEELDSPYDAPANRREASDLINTLKAAKQMTTQVEDQPEPMTDRQRAKINHLMEQRSMSPEQRRKARERIDGGMPKATASHCIDWLLSLPVTGDAAA
jgi:hypothetical protein